MFPNINPVAVSLGPIQIHWYGLAYLMGVLVGYIIFNRYSKKIAVLVNPSDFVSNVMLGIILGGRLGYVFVYEPGYYLNNLHEIFAVWNGGMSFHGGALGAFLMVLYSCKKYRIFLPKALDLLALCVTPGLFFGRIGNFINSELYGRVTSMPWGVIFPTGGNSLRHPSQLYEAFLEGVLLLVILIVVFERFYTPGRVFSIFVFLYALFRFLVEFTREPDAHLGTVMFHLSMGQVLSLVMMVFGGLWWYGQRKNFFR